MSEFEAVGDALTGGILGRAIEPAAVGAGTGELNAPTDCLNCGTRVQGSFCGACGQRRNVHRTITAFGHDLIHGILHLDGKLWRTLPLLAWRPGELTRRYVHGERARFVSPLAMFLFSVFLMFAVLQVHGRSLSGIDTANPQQLREDMDQLRRGMVAELGELHDDRMVVARGKIAKHRGVPQTTSTIDQHIAQLQREIARLDGLREDAAQLRFGEGEPNLQLGLGGLGGSDYVIEEFDRNPRLAFYKLQSNSYKFSWLLIPISVPFVWLLLVGKRRFRFYDHTVFVTYSMAFMSLLASLLTLFGIAGVHIAIIGVAGVIVPPIHIYRQLKAAYGLGRVGALMRTFVLVGFCFVIAGLYLVLLAAMIG